MSSPILRAPRPLLAAGALLTITAFTACETVSGVRGDPREASVSFNVARSGPARSEGPELLMIAEGEHTLDLQALDVVVDDATFWRVNGHEDDDDDRCCTADAHAGRKGNGSNGNRVRVGAATLELPLEGGMITPFRGLLPVGEYDRLTLDFAFIRMRGTYDGKAFDVTLPINTRYTLDIDPPIEIAEDGEGPNVTVNLDLRQWLVAGGAVIDPLRLQTDRSYRAAFVNRIRASLRAIHDCDRDGDDGDSDAHHHSRRKGKHH